jgi:2-dehydro-3-deoxyphosphogluconate aldolase/(4S)-4-hydroxy-2-oxoglutarate aldolase
VDLSTADAFLKAGACCLGVGGSLVEAKAVTSGNWNRLRELASQYADIVRRHRAGG